MWLRGLLISLTIIFYLDQFVFGGLLPVEFGAINQTQSTGAVLKQTSTTAKPWSQNDTSDEDDGSNKTLSTLLPLSTYRSLLDERRFLCSLEPDTGLCHFYVTMYYFDRDVNQCEAFTYGGCFGNNNRFRTKPECMAVCGDLFTTPKPPDYHEPERNCIDPVDSGTCAFSNYEPRFYYNARKRACLPFMWSGCRGSGNGNRYGSFVDCQRRCMTSILSTPSDNSTTTSTTRQVNQTKPMTTFTTRPTPGVQNGTTTEANYFNQTNGTTSSLITTDRGSNLTTGSVSIGTTLVPGNGSEFQTGFWNETTVGTLRNSSTGSFGNFSTSIETTTVAGTNYTVGELGNSSVFNSTTTPRTAAPECFLENDSGHCEGFDYELRYYFDARYSRCRAFMWSGCGGNDNRFSSLADCFSTCGDAVLPSTTTTPMTAPPHRWTTKKLWEFENFNFTDGGDPFTIIETLPGSMQAPPIEVTGFLAGYDRINGNCQGFVIERLKPATLQQCAERCNNTVIECAGFSFDADTFYYPGNLCILKGPSIDCSLSTTPDPYVRFWLKQ